jgi:hypothetical protein
MGFSFGFFSPFFLELQMCFFFLPHFIFYIALTLSSGIEGKYLTNSWNYNEMQTRAHNPNFMHLREKKACKSSKMGLKGCENYMNFQ